MIKDKNGEILIGDEDVRGRWREHFEELLNRPDPVNPISEEIFYGPELELEPPTREETIRAIKRLKNNKSPGKDNIPSEIWKYGGEMIQEKLHDLIITIWNKEITPDQWGERIFVPLHKKGDKLLCSNYRGMCLLPTAYKILTIIIHSRLLPNAEDIIGEYQYGFGAGRSTVDQLFSIRQAIEKYWEYNRQQFHLFIDFKQAYDSIHRTSMWNIMKEFGIPQKLIRVTKACYKNTLCSVRCGPRTATSFSIKSGLKRGCILSPLLFNLVMEKVVRNINFRPEGISFNNMHVNCLGYADDIDIMGLNLREVKDLAVDFSEMASRVGLKINQDKTKVIEIGRIHHLHGNVNIAGIEVEAVESFKYLGTIMSHNAKMTEEVAARIGAANRCYFKQRSISQKAKIRIYDSYQASFNIWL